jgi:hypothetical protein
MTSYIKGDWSYTGITQAKLKFYIDNGAKIYKFNNIEDEKIISCWGMKQPASAITAIISQIEMSRRQFTAIQRLNPKPDEESTVEQQSIEDEIYAALGPSIRSPEDFERFLVKPSSTAGSRSRRRSRTGSNRTRRKK